MKVIFFNLSILFYSFLLCSCNSEDKKPIEKTLEGKWNVTEVLPGMIPAKHFEKGIITIEFDITKGTVFVKNTQHKLDEKETLNFSNLDSGVYKFSLRDSMLIIGKREGLLTFTEEKLTIDYGVAHDDVMVILKR